MIKVKADVLRDFVNKTTAEGLITDCKLEFKNDALHMTHKDTNGVVLIAGILDKSVFVEYEEVTLDIKSTAKLIQTLTIFKDNLVNIVKEDNMVNLLDENGSINLVLAESVTCHKDSVPSLEYDNTILIKKSTVLDIVEKTKIVACDEVIVSNKNNELIFSIGKESDKATSKTVSNLTDDRKTVFDMSYFKKITKNFDTVFDLCLAKEESIPSMFKEKADKYMIQYYITPKTEQE